uniref:Reverse transcriptase zinc-binding domain-containing protein n=1 Tax=Bracon brevicornis TaxID=1563983 RepID=A0A6V7L8Y1_9HYME
MDGLCRTDTGSSQNRSRALTSRKQLETITLNVGECSITSQPYIRYLGVMLDSRLSYTRHVEQVAEKASRVAMSLARLMPSISGPRQDRRKLLATVVVSVLTYGIAIWREVLEMETYRRKVAAAHRISTLRVACAFRTISNDAVCVIANMMPIEVIAIERKQLYAERGGNPAEREKLRRNVKQRSIENIPDCPAVCGTPEDAEHVFFHCARFDQAREELNVRLGGGIEPETIVRFMLEKEENWSAVSSFAKDIMTRLREEDQSRRKAKEPEKIASRVMQRRQTDFWKH